MLRIKTFANYEEIEKYREESGNPYNVIEIIESDTRISVDVQTVCKKKKTAVNRFFQAVKDYPDLMSWEGWFNTDNNENEKIIDERHNYMTGREDYTGNYSIGVECLDGDLWYIYMNVSKEYKELTGLQYDLDYRTEKEIEFCKQTSDIKDNLVNHFETENNGEWTYEFCKSKETIKNIKIQNFGRDRIKGDIQFSYNYTIYENWQQDATKHGDKEYYMSVKIRNGKIDSFWSSNKFSDMVAEEFNKILFAYIKSVTPEFNYLPAVEPEIKANPIMKTICNNYVQFSNLNSGETITLEQFHNIFNGGSMVTIKDNSVRGAATVSYWDVKIGDWVNNGTRFIEIVADTDTETATTEPENEARGENNKTNLVDIVETLKCEPKTEGKRMKKEHWDYFNKTLCKIKHAVNINIPIEPIDFETLKDVDKKTRDYAVGICWKLDDKVYLINIDEFFIEQSYEAEVNGKWWYLDLIEGKTLIKIICHEIAHIYHWNHSKKHEDLTNRLVVAVESGKKYNIGIASKMRQISLIEANNSNNSSHELNNKTLIELIKEGKTLQVEVHDEYFNVCNGIKVNAYTERKDVLQILPR